MAVKQTAGRNCRDCYTCSILLWMAKGMGSIPYGKRSLGRRR